MDMLETLKYTFEYLYSFICGDSFFPEYLLGYELSAKIVRYIVLAFAFGGILTCTKSIWW